ncbi:hypothetical protein [Ktedonobacter racemifer]|uniref:Uncharacterized protein n=1 Tax=Ktedonobacter racemifer DSM 44963 TaxID=485913 RepID=D6U8S5_KTERA|nr:hypothetical protein [Ktedonobacter racemifer]EFH79635.1 hypothetical protein Krac_0113 [Ktedonobacter racemifer DSM 44963]
MTSPTLMLSSDSPRSANCAPATQTGSAGRGNFPPSTFVLCPGEDPNRQRTVYRNLTDRIERQMKRSRSVAWASASRKEAR